MEERIKDFSSSSLMLKIKKEPKDEDESDSCEGKEPNYVTKSLILKFVKDQNGGYSVVSRITPDPFFEEHLDDLCNDDSWVQIKNENEDSLKYEKDQNFNIKQENIDYSDQTDIVGAVNNKQSLNENSHIEDDRFFLTHCSICLYTNTKKLVKRHVQRVHVSITKHSCSFCDKNNFKEPLSLDCHILKNHRDTPGALNRIKRNIFECILCTYKTLKRSNFRRHLSTHGDGKLKKQLESKKEKKSLVEIDSKDEMTRALSTSKYDCFHCPYTTKDKGSMIRHLRLHRETTELPHLCKVCMKNFNEKNSLDSHIIKRHLNNPELVQLITNRVYECDLCDYKDVNKNKVLRHKKARHVKKEKIEKKSAMSRSR